MWAFSFTGADVVYPDWRDQLRWEKPGRCVSYLGGRQFSYYIVSCVCAGLPATSTMYFIHILSYVHILQFEINDSDHSLMSMHHASKNQSFLWFLSCFAHAQRRTGKCWNPAQ